MKQPSKRDVYKEMREHPWASKRIAKRIASDHANPKKKARKVKVSFVTKMGRVTFYKHNR